MVSEKSGLGTGMSWDPGPETEIWGGRNASAWIPVNERESPPECK